MKYIQFVTQDTNVIEGIDVEGFQYKLLETDHIVAESSDGRNFDGRYTQLFDSETYQSHIKSGRSDSSGTRARTRVSLATYRRLRRALDAFAKEACGGLPETRNGGTWRCVIDG